MCNGFEDKEEINTDIYFDHMINDENKKKKEKNDPKKFPKKLKKKNKQKKKRLCKNWKNLDIDCRICFSHKVHDINPVVYCSKFKSIFLFIY